MSDTPLELRLQAENLLKAINEGTGSARALIVTLLVLAVYIFIVVAGTNDEQLLRNSSVAVPTLSNAVVPANAFYAVMPWAFVFLHLDLLIHLGLMSDKLYRFNEAVEAIPDPLEARDLRLRLAGFPFANWLGSDPRQAWVLYLLQGLTVWLSLVVIPLLLLTYLQLGFLAYHSVGITWGHRLALIADVSLLLYFWPRLGKGRYRLPQPERPVLRFSIRQWMVWRRPLRKWRRLWADWNQRLIAALPSPVKAAVFRFAWRWDRALALPKALLLVVWGLINLGSGLILRRLWVIAITPLAAPLLFLSLLVATIPQEAMDNVARQWLGEVKAHDMEKAFSAIADDEAPDDKKGEPVSAHAQDCAHGLTQLLPWVPRSWKAQNPRLVRYAQGGIELPQTLSATCLTLALFHLHGSPFHRTLRVQDRVIASGELRPDVVKQVRSTLNANKNVASPELLREFEEAVFEVQGLDLTERDLRFGDFRGSSFPRAIFDKARLDHARLEKTDLRKASLRQTLLFAADLRHAYLRNADLRGVTLLLAELFGADLSDANLRDANLIYAAPKNANLSGADLRGADLLDANLSGADLRGADLTDADLTGADLSCANLLSATLLGVHLTGADLYVADLRFAKLSGALLNGTDLTRADLRFANLGGTYNRRVAELFGAELINSDIRFADFSGANLSGVNFTGAEQAGVLMLEPVITGALGNKNIEAILKIAGIPELIDRRGLERKLRKRLGTTTKELDLSACIGIPPCPADMPSLQRHTKQRTQVLNQLICPAEGQVTAKTAESVIMRLKMEAKLDLENPLPPSPWLSALAAAAAQALIEMASGSCRNELSKFIPKEYQPQTNTPVPASPPTPQPSSSQP